MICIVSLQGRDSVFCNPWPMSALGQVLPFQPSLPNGCFAPKAVIRLCRVRILLKFADGGVTLGVDAIALRDEIWAGLWITKPSAKTDKTGS